MKIFSWRNWDDVFLKSEMGRQHLLVEMIRDHKMTERHSIFEFENESEVYPDGRIQRI